jgi:hypothetical protein
MCCVNSFETMNFMNVKRNGKEGLMASKVDMSKAYNRFE